ncbi:MAG: sulfotransferase domain-containing protein [Pseudomonadota bacterium]|nr:sulfotransferase [Sphingomonas sp.]MDQ3479322.1 sulfotransferase domain-containing protein [Pseudomonadota bacterium]
MKPNLFIVGAPKCGTTAWAQYLGTHPDIHISALKEPHYFCTDFPKLKKVASEGEYLALFAGGASKSVIGEASASYLYSKEAAENLRRFAPDAKIIIFVRDRPGLLFSWHSQLLYNRVENRSDFEQAWRLSGQRKPRDHGPACDEKSFLDYRSFGKLNEQVDRFLASFPADQVRVFHLEDWSRDPRATYLEIMRFLGVEDDGRTEFPRVNEAKRSRSKLVSLFFRKPPRAAAAVYHFVRRLTGWEAAPLTAKLVQLNSKPGYDKSLPASLREEIERTYADDEARLRPKIWRPSPGNGASAA